MGRDLALLSSMVWCMILQPSKCHFDFDVVFSQILCKCTQPYPRHHQVYYVVHNVMMLAII